MDGASRRTLRPTRRPVERPGDFAAATRSTNLSEVHSSSDEGELVSVEVSDARPIPQFTVKHVADFGKVCDAGDVPLFPAKMDSPVGERRQIFADPRPLNSPRSTEEAAADVRPDFALFLLLDEAGELPLGKDNLEL